MNAYARACDGRLNPDPNLAWCRPFPDPHPCPPGSSPALSTRADPFFHAIERRSHRETRVPVTALTYCVPPCAPVIESNPSVAERADASLDSTSAAAWLVRCPECPGEKSHAQGSSSAGTRPRISSSHRHELAGTRFYFWSVPGQTRSRATDRVSFRHHSDWRIAGHRIHRAPIDRERP